MGVVSRPAVEDTDAEIIRRMHGGPEVFAMVFDRYYSAIHGYAARRLGRDLADDVAAEVFLFVLDQWQRYDTSQESARPWLFGIASNLIAGHRRAEARRYRAIARTDRAGTAGDEHADGHADRVAVRIDAQALRGRLAVALGDIAPLDRWSRTSCWTRKPTSSSVVGTSPSPITR